MSTFNITVIDTDESVKTISIPVDAEENLMHVLRDGEFDVPGACGGMAACGTCHIAVLEGSIPNEIDTDEEFMLDGLPNVQDNSRLACQVPTVAGLEGLKIQVLGDV